MNVVLSCIYMGLYIDLVLSEDQRLVECCCGL